MKRIDQGKNVSSSSLAGVLLDAEYAIPFWLTWVVVVACSRHIDLTAAEAMDCDESCWTSLNVYCKYGSDPFGQWLENYRLFCRSHYVCLRFVTHHTLTKQTSASFIDALVRSRARIPESQLLSGSKTSTKHRAYLHIPDQEWHHWLRRW